MQKILTQAQNYQVSKLTNDIFVLSLLEKITAGITDQHLNLPKLTNGWAAFVSSEQYKKIRPDLEHTIKAKLKFSKNMLKRLDSALASNHSTKRVAELIKLTRLGLQLVNQAIAELAQVNRDLANKYFLELKELGKKLQQKIRAAKNKLHQKLAAEQKLQLQHNGANISEADEIKLVVKKLLEWLERLFKPVHNFSEQLVLDPEIYVKFVAELQAMGIQQVDDFIREIFSSLLGSQFSNSIFSNIGSSAQFGNTNNPISVRPL